MEGLPDIISDVVLYSRPLEAGFPFVLFFSISSISSSMEEKVRTNLEAVLVLDERFI